MPPRSFLHDNGFGRIVIAPPPSLSISISPVFFWIRTCNTVVMQPGENWRNLTANRGTGQALGEAGTNVQRKQSLFISTGLGVTGPHRPVRASPKSSSPLLRGRGITGARPALCVECMAENEDLYKQYSAGNLRLTRCRVCGDFVDRYIEYDAVLIIIGLILHKNPIYRHLMYNDSRFIITDAKTGKTEVNAMWRLAWYACMIVILDTWTKLIAVDKSSCQGGTMKTAVDGRWITSTNKNERWNVVETLQDPGQIYHVMLCACLASLENIVYVGVLAIGAHVAFNAGLVHQKEALDKFFIGKAFIISSFCRPMLLLFLIWDYKPDFIHVLNFFAMTSNIAVMSSVFDDAIGVPIIITGLAFTCRSLAQVLFHVWFGLPSMFSTQYSPW